MNHVPRPILALCALAVIFASCAKNSSYPSAATLQASGTPPPNTVVISNFAFSPETITVSWKNTDGVAHTSTSDARMWDTGNIAPGGNATTTFTTRGTFSYHCTQHPMMTGTVIVQ